MFGQTEGNAGEATTVRIRSYDPQVIESELRSGLHIWVNFGGQEFNLPDGSLLGPMSFVRRRIRPS